MTRHVIINADDFGASPGINRGIIEAHARGIVTSTSLMVTGSAVREAVQVSRDYPELGIGLHWDVTGEGDRDFAFGDPVAIRQEVRRQLDEFVRLMGRPPTHFDSHHHVHRRDGVMQVVHEVIGPELPMRGDGKANFVGGFYAQWEWGKTDLYHVSCEFLTKLLREEVGPDWTELSCHPGYVDDGFRSMYLTEREAELRTLTDARVKRAVDEFQIRLANYVHLTAARGQGRAA